MVSLQVVQAFAQCGGDLRCGQLAVLDQAQGRDQLRTDAVVHVAHDAAAFFDNRLLAFHHLHALVVTCQLGVLFGDALFQFRVEFFGSR